jgi:glycosyltransferase involved in cell wall biosynthesis
MPKVLHVISGLEVGGAQTMLAHLTDRLDRTRIQSVVVDLIPGPMASRFEANGTPSFSLGMRRGVPDPRAFFRLCAIIAREQPDVIQTWLYHADLLGLLAARFKGVGATSWNIRASNFPADQTLLAVTRRALAALSPIPDLVIVNSQSGRSYHERLGYRPRRWALIPNGFETERFRPDPKARAAGRALLGIDAATPIVAMIARFDPMKDYRTFFEASRLFSAERPDVRFVVAGNGVDEHNARISEWLSTAGINRERYRLLGVQPAIETLLPSFDLVSLSSAYGEGFPNVIGEAMAAGVPCVATDVGDVRWLIGDTGRVVPPRSPGLLANAWAELLSLDEETRRAFGARARLRIERDFALDRIVGMYADAFTELGEASRVRRRSRRSRVTRR